MPLPLRYVTRVSFDLLREPFRKVWSNEAQRVDFDLQGTKVKIYRVGKNLVRIDIPDYNYADYLKHGDY